MKDDRLMHRLRAARPVAAEPGNHAGLFARIVAEPGDPRLGEAPRERSSRILGRKVRPWTRARPRFLAGSTLGLAGVGTALVLALSGSAAPPAFAITTNGDGSVLVNINRLQSLPAANHKLTAMGIHEQVTIYMATGPAAVSGPVTCTPAPGANRSGPPLEVLVGKDGTEVIRPGQSAGNTGVGTYHLDHCVVTGDTGSGNTGNTGNTSTG
ncbi:MAG TPA: hypothetical protein VG365_00460 [Solirubrobacteraceae bacterium]|jgi:hypothetical protein|nr:hypothetical protein [Solirubrobacteraceae bacterium]